jgi:hypothetical protein
MGCFAARRIGAVGSPFAKQAVAIKEGVPMAKDGLPEEFSAENLMFDANLKEFATRVGVICGLEAGGRLTAQQAYAQIRDLWKQLKRSHRNLGIGESEN